MDACVFGWTNKKYQVNIYFIPGLGVDNRVFQKLELPSHLNVHYLEWILPISLTESIKEYAKRLAQSIDVKTPYIIVGLSFGGIIAKELQAFLNPEKTNYYFKCFISRSIALVFQNG